MLLHTLNKPDGDTLRSCLRSALPDSAILLMEDGVYAALKDSPAAKLIAGASRLRLYALLEDCRARGIENALAAGMELVDYRGFVRLSVEAHAVQSWH